MRDFVEEIGARYSPMEISLLVASQRNAGVVRDLLLKAAFSKATNSELREIRKDFPPGTDADVSYKVRIELSARKEEALSSLLPA